MKSRKLSAKKSRPASSAERKAAERERYRALGRTAVQVWVHPDDALRLRIYVNRLNRAREE